MTDDPVTYSEPLLAALGQTVSSTAAVENNGFAVAFEAFVDPFSLDPRTNPMDPRSSFHMDLREEETPDSSTSGFPHTSTSGDYFHTSICIVAQDSNSGCKCFYFLYIVIIL